MSSMLAIITISVLILTATLMWKTYNVKILLHPGFYFCLVWILAISSYLYINTFPNKYNVINPVYVDELHSFILFTAICFLILKNRGKFRVKENRSDWTVYNFTPLFKKLTIIVLIAAIATFIYRGAFLDLALNRNTTVDLDTVVFLSQSKTPALSMLLGSFTSLNLILAIFAGFLFGEKRRGELKFTINNIYLVIPMLTQIIMMVIIGGRNDLVWIFRCYTIGTAISIANGISKIAFKRIIIFCFLFIMIFLAYSNFNIEQRKTDIAEILTWEDKPLLKPFKSVIEYFSETYIGFQLRRDDFVTQELEYGQKTFSGILFLEIPFAGAIGIRDVSIGDVFGVERYSMKKMVLELQDRNRAFSGACSSMYLLIYDDFGYVGTFIVIFLFVVLTQLVYVKWFETPNKSFFSLYFLLLFFILWSNSIFDPVFSSGHVRTILYSVILIQFAIYFTKTINKSIYSSKKIRTVT